MGGTGREGFAMQRQAQSVCTTCKEHQELSIEPCVTQTFCLLFWGFSSIRNNVRVHRLSLVS